MNLPNIDVVLLSWNRLEDTLEAVENVLMQEGVNPVLWIVDQGSDAACVQSLREFALCHGSVKLIELGENRGIAAGRNRGMGLGSAEVIVSLDNDALFADNTALRSVVARFDSDQKLGAVGFKILNYFTKNLDAVSWVYPRGLLPQCDSSFYATRYCGAGHALRRSALAKTQSYDESLFFYWEELDLSYQLIGAGYSILYDPSVVILHKRSPEGRFDWRGDRYYYLVRNALYLDWKYFCSLGRLIRLAAGYQLKGVYNRLAGKALRGIMGGVKKAFRLDKENRTPLKPEALAYIETHDLKYRGGLLRRLKTEVFEKLPN